jgi:hypothetical protein
LNIWQNLIHVFILGYYCSSCYAYSAQAAIEGAIFKKFRKLVKLSDQNIIDCNKNVETGNWGCDVRETELLGVFVYFGQLSGWNHVGGF